MQLFSQLLSIVIVGLAATMLAVYVANSLAYLIRNLFGFKDPDLGWDPSANIGMTYRQRIPDLNASDMAEGLYRD